jgi:hypothetical protein
VLTWNFGVSPGARRGFRGPRNDQDLLGELPCVHAATRVARVVEVPAVHADELPQRACAGKRCVRARLFAVVYSRFIDRAWLGFVHWAAQPELR